MSRFVTYGQTMLRRVPQVRRCGANLGTAVRYADALTRRRLGGDRHYTFKHRGLSFVARPEDWVTVNEVCLMNEYGFLDEFFTDQPPQTILDLGANIGLFALESLGRWPTAAIYTVEASSSTYRILRQNCARHPQANWTTYQAAVMDRTGTASFGLSDYSTARRLAHAESSESAATEEVPATTLPALLEQFKLSEIDLLKIDIEGAEEQVLASSASVLRNTRQVVLELHPEQCDAAAVRAMLSSAFKHVHDLPRAAGGKPIVFARA